MATWWLRPGDIEKNRLGNWGACMGKPMIAALTHGNIAIGPFKTQEHLLAWAHEHPLYHGDISSFFNNLPLPFTPLSPDIVHDLWVRGLTGDPKQDHLLSMFKEALGIPG